MPASSKSASNKNGGMDVPVSSTIIRRNRLAAQVVLKDTTDLKWWLYGKNAHFEILHESVVTIQAFVRGCMCRARTSEWIESMIEDILTTREARDRYAEEDKHLREEKQQLERAMQNGDVSCPSSAEVGGAGTDSKSGNRLLLSSRRTEEVFKPWRPETDHSFLEIVLEQQCGDADGNNDSGEKKKARARTVVVPPRKVAPGDLEPRLQDRLRLWENASVAMNNRKRQQQRVRREQQR
jgi:hypothetical protein